MMACTGLVERLLMQGTNAHPKLKPCTLGDNDNATGSLASMLAW